MIELQLDDKFKITSDQTEMNYILNKYEEKRDLKTKEPTGEYAWKVLGYFGLNFKHALNTYKEMNTISAGNTDIDRLIERFDKLERHIDKVVKRENIRLIVKEKDKDNDND